jgi:hypothetical protein
MASFMSRTLMTTIVILLHAGTAQATEELKNDSAAAPTWVWDQKANKLVPKTLKSPNLPEVNKNAAFASSCSDDATICTQTELCKKATWRSNSGRVWDIHQKVSQHVTEAKRRGLTCGVGEVVAIKVVRKVLSEEV